MKQLIRKSVMMEAPAMTLFEAIEQEDEVAIISLLKEIIRHACHGELSADDIFIMLEEKELILSPAVKQMISDALHMMQDNV